MEMNIIHFGHAPELEIPIALRRNYPLRFGSIKSIEDFVAVGLDLNGNHSVSRDQLGYGLGKMGTQPTLLVTGHRIYEGKLGNLRTIIGGYAEEERSKAVVSSYGLTDPVDIVKVAVHEIGHIFGLKHHSVNGDPICPMVNNPEQQSAHSITDLMVYSWLHQLSEDLCRDCSALLKHLPVEAQYKK